MKSELQQLKKEFEQGLKNVSDLLGLEQLEQQFFARKSGKMSLIMKQLKDVSDDVRKEIGKASNELKQDLEVLLGKKRSELQREAMKDIETTESIDVTQPALGQREPGHLHPNTIIQHQLEDLFESMGFIIEETPELESDYHNFEALNIPSHHPARDMQDTFYIKGHDNWVMRTHTSPIQVRGPLKHGVPLRAVVPGRCFRNEATDVRHEHTFYQLDGVVIDKKITFADMKGVLEAVAKHLYGDDTEVRLRPKLYPFVEPGVNGEVTCFLCKGEGCNLCKKTGWLEIFGSGPMHPNVLRAGGVDPDEYQGFAFGFGLSRLVMLKYGIEDNRHFQRGDLRFLKQF